ncbi:hypothetical protein [Micromonospora humida]|uniref:Uncharacterized protein n=1 Tax=Micromonospora humida TaxID=2809018 RepID=A0ABS2IN31_9ACTN|nr:hypothetical protein [Micromonospora humida]MBM7075755.1 hypothetical protein [Micromonospora humida]
MSNGGDDLHAWLTFLRRWRNAEPADPHGLPPLAPESLPADGWFRFVQLLNSALTERLQAWVDGLLKALTAAGDEFDRGRALAQGRRGLVPIRAVAGHPGLPEPLARHLRGLVDEQVVLVQQTLEEGVETLRRAGGDGRLVENRLRTLRENSLTASVAHFPGPLDEWATEPVRPSRRIITGPSTTAG